MDFTLGLLTGAIALGAVGCAITVPLLFIGARLGVRSRKH